MIFLQGRHPVHIAGHGVSVSADHWLATVCIPYLMSVRCGHITAITAFQRQLAASSTAPLAQPQTFLVVPCLYSWHCLPALPYPTLPRYGAHEAERRLLELRCIWISHMHADHHGGLYRLLELRARLMGPEHATPLLIIGPIPLFNVLRSYQKVVRYRKPSGHTQSLSARCAA
jgi:ribonuclease BN (tRNA processing enzyme)